MNNDKVRKVGYKIGYAGGVVIFFCGVALVVALVIKAIMMLFGGM